MNVILACCKIFFEESSAPLRYGIGLNNKLPWHIPSELKLFREKTEGQILLIGSKTCDALPPLPNRTVIRLSRSENITDVIKNLREKHPEKKIFIAGGKQIYDWFFTQSTLQKDVTLHLSLIHKEYKCDTFLDHDIYQGWEIKDQKIYEEFTHYELSYNPMGEHQYLQLLRNVLRKSSRPSRNALVRSDFFNTLSFDLSHGFPLLTTKKMFVHGVLVELLFFLRGETNTELLREQNVHIWDGNTNREFLNNHGFSDRKEWVMGPMYGYQLRNFGAEYDEKTASAVVDDTKHEKNRVSGIDGVDQLANVIHLIKTDPTSRRIMMTVFNPKQADQGVLYPCHSIVVQFYVEDEWLDMSCYNRSQDLFLGTPFNIASSAFLLSIIAKVCGLRARILNLALGDCHIYTEHEEAVKTQLNRFPYTFPHMKIKKELHDVSDIETLKPSDFEIEEYCHHEKIIAKMIA